MITEKEILELIIEEKTISEIADALNISVEQIKEILSRIKDKCISQTFEENKTPVKCENAIVYCDGASRSNPGLSGVGVVIYDKNNKEILRDKKFIGIGTNNTAEYKALLFSLELLKKIDRIKHVSFKLDSELVVKQIKGEYKISSPSLKLFYEEFFMKIKKFEGFSIEHVRREKNKVADMLANQAIDDHNNIKPK